MSEREIDLKIIVDQSGAIQSFTSLDQTIKKSKDSTTNLNNTLNETGKNASITGGAISTALGSMADRAISNLASKLSQYTNIFQQLRDIAPIEAQRASFEVLSQRIGGNAVTALDQLRSATKGYVNDADLVAVSNQAILLGVNKNSQEFAKLTENAVKLGDAMGKTAKESVESLTLGIGRQSPLILDNLGIMVNAETAYKNFAKANGTVADALTESQKKLAFQQEAFKAITEKAAGLPPVLDTSADAVQFFDATLSNLASEVVTSISNNQDLRDSINEFAKSLKDVDLTEFAKNIGDLASLIVKFGSALTEYGVPALNLFSDSLRSVGDYFDIFASGLQNTNGNLFALGGGIQKAFDTKATEIATDKINEYNKATADLYKKVISGSQEVSTKITQQGATALKKIVSDFENHQDKFGANKSKLVPQIEKIKTSLAEYDKKALQLNKTTKENTTQVENNSNAQSKNKTKITETERATSKLNDTIREITTGRGNINEIAESFDKVFDNRFVKSTTQLDSEINKLVNSFKLAKKPIADIEDGLKQASDRAEDFNKSISETDRKLRELNPINLGSLFSTDTTGFTGNDTGRDQEIKDATERGKAIGNAFASAFGDALNTVLKGGSLRDQLSGIGSGLGGSLGTIIGGPIGGAIGDAIGSQLGTTLSKVGKDTATTIKALKDDPYIRSSLAVFSAGLSEILDLNSVFGAGNKNKQNRKAFKNAILNIFEDANRDFNEIFGKGFDIPKGAFTNIVDEFGNTTNAMQQKVDELHLDPQLANDFQGLAVAFATSMDLPISQVSEFGNILALNLQNASGLNQLQIAFQQAGLNVEDMGAKMEDAFLKGNLSAGMLLQGLEAVKNISQKGIPGAVGATDLAFQNLAKNGLKSGADAMDALGDLAVEAGEKGVKSLDGLKQALLAQGMPAQQVNQLFDQLGKSGIKTLEQLKNISVASTASVVAGLEAQKNFFASQTKNIEELEKKLNTLSNKEIEVKLRFSSEYDSDSTRKAVENNYGSSGIGAG